MKLHATGSDLLIKEKERLISGSVNMNTCEFTFDSSWDGYTVTAVFSTNGSRLINMAVVDGKCSIPVEVLRPNARIRIGIFGTDGVRSRPTTYSEWITVEQGADVTGSSAQPPTPSVYEQWINELDKQHDEWAEAEQARQEAEKERQDLESGYVARAESAAEDAEYWAAQAKNAAGGDFATTEEAKGYASEAERNANTYTDKQIASIPKPDVSAEIKAHNEDTSSHEDMRNAIGGLQAKPSYDTVTMTASSWSDNTYSFEATYPKASYDISIEVASTATAEQFEAFGGAMICGSADSNIATALGDVPTVDIPIIIKVVAK